MQRFIIVILLLIGAKVATSQQTGWRDAATLSKLYAETKQIGQFIARFNGEEDAKGNKITQNNEWLRVDSLRELFIPLVFDNANSQISAMNKRRFAAYSIDNEHYLVFRSDQWLAELQTDFIRDGQEYQITFFLQVEEENDGYKWVINGIFTDYYKNTIENTTGSVKPFLHPKSHELDFMNLGPIFQRATSLQLFTAQDYYPDQLTLFLIDFQEGKWQWKNNRGVKFHFWQIPGWYFELRYFNRSTYNSGWLISNLQQITPQQQSTIQKTIKQR